MASVSAPLRMLLAVGVVVAGLVSLSDLLGGPSFGKGQGAVAAGAWVAWWVGFNAKDRKGDRTERWLFWVGVSCAAILFVGGVVEAPAG